MPEDKMNVQEREEITVEASSGREWREENQEHV